MNWLISIAGAMALLVMLGLMQSHDEAVIGTPRRACVPANPGEIASARMARDGHVECSITSAKSGRRTVIERW